MPEQSKDIGQRIAARREHLRMSQEEVATLSGLKRAAYSHMENGINEIKVTDLIKIAKALRTKVAYLVGEITEEEMIDQQVLTSYRRLTANQREVVQVVIEAMARQNQDL